MIARHNDKPAFRHGGKLGDEQGSRLLCHKAAVKKVARKNHDIRLFGFGKQYERRKRAAKLVFTHLRLLHVKKGKRRIQMDVRRMNDFRHGSSLFFVPISKNLLRKLILSR